MFEYEKEGGAMHYVKVGLEAYLMLSNQLSITQSKVPGNILDFGCGYGRVLRFLVSGFKNSKITGCEMDAVYTDFCSETFNVETFISNSSYDTLPTDIKYDLIWAGSVFTHISAKKFEELLDYFVNILEPGGMAVFTTHGRFAEQNVRNNVYGLRKRASYAMLAAYKIFGYGYWNYKNAKDYGVSIMKPSYFMKLIYDRKDIELVTYNERYWDRHQDVISIRKI